MWYRDTEATMDSTRHEHLEYEASTEHEHRQLEIWEAVEHHFKKQHAEACLCEFTISREGSRKWLNVTLQLDIPRKLLKKLGDNAESLINEINTRSEEGVRQ